VHCFPVSLNEIPQYETLSSNGCHRIIYNRCYSKTYREPFPPQSISLPEGINASKL
jgi:hypothetical protein